MTASETATRNQQLDADRLQEYLRIAERQVEIYENAWFTARRCRADADFPDMPAADTGTLESTAEDTSIPLRDIRESATHFAAVAACLAKEWEARVRDIKAQIHRARQRM